MKDRLIAVLLESLIELLTSHATFHLETRIDQINLRTIQFSQVNYETLILYSFRHTSKIFENMLVPDMWIDELGVDDDLVMILPAHFNNAGELVGVIWDYIVDLVFAFGVDFGDNVGVQFGEFLLHLLHLQFLTVYPVTDVVRHRHQAHPEYASEYATTGVLHDNQALFF